ncbi:unnamed protein product [Arabidopsis arenosa]|nr:unnamed protein product [Arabidopsis arenosa]
MASLSLSSKRGTSSSSSSSSSAFDLSPKEIEKYRGMTIFDISLRLQINGPFLVDAYKLDNQANDILMKAREAETKYKAFMKLAEANNNNEDYIRLAINAKNESDDLLKVREEKMRKADEIRNFKASIPGRSRAIFRMLGSTSILIGVAETVPGMVIELCPMLRSTNVGFQPSFTAQFRSTLADVLFPESISRTMTTIEQNHKRKPRVQVATRLLGS